MPATLDAAALCKMADRGQIAGAVLDGPLAFDNAVSAAAARTRASCPTSRARPTSWSFRISRAATCSRSSLYLGGAASAGIVIGARVPIVLTSRADPREARIASCAVALVPRDGLRRRSHHCGAVEESAWAPAVGIAAPPPATPEVRG